MGFIYILTNPSFPKHVKIGYADDVNKRLEQLNRSECIPYAFRLYAYYEVPVRLTDVKVHSIIDKLNPKLRSVDYVNGKKRVKEFYAMEPSDAYDILEAIAEIHGMQDNLHHVEPSADDIKNDEEATEVRIKRKVKTLPKMEWLIEQGVVKIGDEIFVTNHPNELATIVNNDNVKYKDEIMSFNQFGCKVTGWKSIQCYVWMKIKGRNDTLADLREKKMQELGMIE